MTTPAMGMTTGMSMTMSMTMGMSMGMAMSMTRHPLAAKPWQVPA